MFPERRDRFFLRRSCAWTKVSWTKGKRKKLTQHERPLQHARLVARMNGHIVGGELAQFLAAAAAWSDEAISAPDNCHLNTSQATC
jgi:hypothetical protein